MLKISNTLTKQLDDFKPINENKVNLFVCGPTVYDYPHLGHAKTYTQFDFIVRYLRYRGYEVFYLQNITDIDDKIIARAKEANMKWNELAQKFEEIYKEDMIALGNTSVNQYARATDHIDTIIKQVKDLMDKGYAYETIDGIYYEINKFSEYGKLSGRTSIEENDALSRIDVSDFKRGWNDFCLWKKPKEGDPFWSAEFGDGRPGWHIEDTAITEKYFGPQYDVHGGAIDLIFPHHECEIAQMEAASGKKPLVKYWLHTGFLNINNDKMSKSSGNFEKIRDVLRNYDFRTIRFFLLSSHYKSSINFNIESLTHAKSTLKNVSSFIDKINPNFDDFDMEQIILNLKNDIIKALDEDFNTPKAFAHLFLFIKKFKQKPNLGIRVKEFFEKDLNSIFGDIFVDTGIFNDGNKINNVLNVDEIEALIQERNNFKEKKMFDRADLIRKELEARGIKLRDGVNGTNWEVA